MIDPIVSLKKDHREAAELLKTLAASKPGARRNATVKKLDAALKLQMHIEEQLVYPLVAKLVGTEEAKGAGIEHGLIRDGLVNLTKLDDEPGFGAAVAMLTAGIKHHVKEEEREMFPELKKKLDRDALAALGDEVKAAKSAKKSRRWPVTPNSTPRFNVRLIGSRSVNSRRCPSTKTHRPVGGATAHYRGPAREGGAIMPARGSGTTRAENRGVRDDCRSRPPTARRVRQRPRQVGGAWVAIPCSRFETSTPVAHCGSGPSVPTRAPATATATATCNDRSVLRHHRTDSLLVAPE